MKKKKAGSKHPSTEEYKLDHYHVIDFKIPLTEVPHYF